MVKHQTFDYIFFAILGIPFILGLLELFKPGWLEPLIREWPWESRRRTETAHPIHQPPGAPPQGV